MKKIYRHPKTINVKVEPTKIMAGSPDYGGTTEETSGNLSRDGGSFWDDDEEN